MSAVKAAGRKAAGVSLLRRRAACANAKFEVFLDDVRMPDGRRVEDFLVVAPRVKAGDLVTGAAVIPLWEGRVGLLRVHRHAVGRLVWEIPRGFVDPGENPLRSALRELEEETGLSCAARDAKALGAVMPESGMIAARVRLYLAARCVRTAPFQRGQDGHAALRFFSPARVASMIRRSEIEDPSTIAAFHRAAPFLP